jgi:hypothetical protein
MRLGFGATQDAAGGGSNTIGQAFTAGLDRQWRLHRGSINLSGDASKFHYSSSSDLSQITFGANFSAAYELTPRTRFTLADGISRGYARQTSAGVLTAARLLFPTALTTTHSLGGTLAHDLSRRTQMQGSIQYTRISFDSSDVPGPPTTPDEAAVLGGGWTSGSRFTVQRQVSRADSLGVVHEFSVYNSGAAENATTHAIRALWQRRVGESFTLSAEGGVNAFFIKRLDGVRLAPTAAVTLSRAFRTSTLAVRVERLMEVFGAAHVSEVITPSYGVRIGRNLTIGLEGTFARNTFPADPEFGYQAFVGTVNARYRLPANLVVSGAYSHWDRILTQRDAPTITTYYSNITLGYARSWR